MYRTVFQVQNQYATYWDIFPAKIVRLRICQYKYIHKFVLWATYMRRE